MDNTQTYTQPSIAKEKQEATPNAAEVSSVEGLLDLDTQIATFDERKEQIPGYMSMLLPVKTDLRDLRGLRRYINSNIVSLRRLIELFGDKEELKKYTFAEEIKIYGTSSDGKSYHSGYQDLDYTPERVSILLSKAPEIIEGLEKLAQTLRIIDSVDFYKALDVIAEEILETLEENPSNTFLYLNKTNMERSHGYIVWLMYILVKTKAKEQGRNLSPRVAMEDSEIGDDDPVYVLDDFVLRKLKIFSYVSPNTQKRLKNVRHRVVAKRGVVNDQNLQSVYTATSDETPFSSTICDCDYTFTENNDVTELLRKIDFFPMNLKFKKRGTNDSYENMQFLGSDQKPKLLTSRFERIYTRPEFMNKLRTVARYT